MEKLIDADALFKAYENIGWYNNADRDEIAEKILLEQPTVDAVPRDFHDKCMEIEIQKRMDLEKHGHWTIEDIITYERSYGGTLYEPVYKCSCCGRATESYVRGDEPIMPEDADFPKFCGNCGAKMDEVKE